MSEYFGSVLLSRANEAPLEHPALYLLLKRQVVIDLVLKARYSEYMAPSRSIEEIVNHAWERRENITPASPEPFLRRALERFTLALEKKEVAIDGTNKAWPTIEWTMKAGRLRNLIGQTNA